MMIRLSSGLYIILKFQFQLVIIFTLFVYSFSSLAEELQDKYVSIQSYAAPYTLNPVTHTHVTIRSITTQLFSPLLIMNNKREPEPYLAKDWELADDHKSITLYLENKAVFHDGHAITAEDVKFSIEMVKKHHPFRVLYEHLTEVVITNPYQLTLYFAKPHPAIFYVLSSPFTPIIPKHIYGDGQPFKNHPEFKVPVGSGPYMFSKQNKENVTLDSFPDFFRGKPKVGGLTFIFTQSYAKLNNLVPELDVIPLHIQSEFDFIKKHFSRFSSNQSGLDGYAATTYLTLNTQVPELSNAMVRKAIALSIDKQVLQKYTANPQAPYATGALHPNSPFYFKGDARIEPKLDLANKLLDQTPYLRGKDGLRFSLTILTSPYYSSNSLGYVGMTIKRNLAKLGISLIIQNVGFLEASYRTSMGDYQVTFETLYEWGDPLVGMHRQYHSKNILKGVPYSNSSNYENSELDDLLEQASVTIDFEARNKLYTKIQQILQSEIPQIPLTTVSVNLLYDTRLTGLPNSLFGTSVPMDKLQWH